ncbi:hypothetical protein STEG23_017047 [Scotinomys teguina]
MENSKRKVPRFYKPSLTPMVGDSWGHRNIWEMSVPTLVPMQPLPVKCTVFVQSEDVNGVTGKQELDEISEDCVWLPQEVALLETPGSEVKATYICPPDSHMELTLSAAVGGFWTPKDMSLPRAELSAPEQL